MAQYHSVIIPELVSPCRSCKKQGQRCRSKCQQLNQFVEKLDNEYFMTCSDSDDEGYSISM